jgi:hypothetical protein
VLGSIRDLIGWGLNVSWVFSNAATGIRPDERQQSQGDKKRSNNKDGRPQAGSGRLSIARKQPKDRKKDTIDKEEATPIGIDIEPADF